MCLAVAAGHEAVADSRVQDMRRLWQGLAIVAAILAAAVVTLYINPPSTFINSRAEREAKGFGVDMDVRGRSSWSLRPLPAVRLLDVVVANPPGVAGEPVLRASAVDITTRLAFDGIWPTLQPATVRVETPVVRLDALGGVGGAPAAGGGACKPLGAGTTPLGTIVINNGTIAYAEGTGRVEKVFARIAQPTVESPIEAAFETTLKGDRIDGKASLPKLQALLACAPIRTVATVVAPRGRLELDAMLEREKGPRAVGKARLSVPSIEDFANWLGIDPRTAGSGAVAFSGDVTVEQAAAATSAGRPATEAVPGGGAGWQVAVRNGTLAIGDVRGKPEHNLERIEASGTFSSLAAPASAAVDLVYNGERIEAQAVVERPTALLPAPATRQEQAPVKTGITGRVATAQGRVEFAGDLHQAQETAFVGRAKGSTGSLRALATLARFEVPVETGLEAAEVESDVSATFARLRRWSLKLWNTRLSVDETRLRGALTIDRSEARPRIGGKLEADRIDVRRYVPRSAAEPPGAGGGSRVGSASGGSPPDPFTPRHDPFAALESVTFKDTLQTEIDEIEGRPRRRAGTEAPAAVEEWSTRDLGLAALKEVDVDLELAVGELKLDQRTYALPSLKSELKDGRLTVMGRDIAAHGGKLKADLLVDAQSAEPQLKAALEAAGVEVEQVLSDLGIRPVLAGKAEARADITAVGNNMKAWVSSVSGNIRTSAVGSSLVGWDLRTSWQQMVARFRKGLGLAPPQPSARTPVERLTAAIRIDKGEVVTQEQIQLSGPQFVASAEGKASLPRQQVDYRGTFSTFIAPKVEIPFRASGPWSAAQPGLDRERLGPFKTIQMIFNVLFTGGSGQLESVGAASAEETDPELTSLMRSYMDKVEAKGGLSPAEAEALRELRRSLGGEAR